MVDVKGSEFHSAGHSNAVDNICGNPDRALCWHDPEAVLGFDCHDAAAGMNQLIGVVSMGRDEVAAGMIFGASKKGALEPDRDMRRDREFDLTV